MDTITFLNQRKQELLKELAGINRAIIVVGGKGSSNDAVKPHGRVFTAAAKRKMSMAAKARWATLKKKAK